MSMLVNPFEFTTAPPPSGTTWDPAHKDPTVTLSNGNLTEVTASAFSRGAYATTSQSSGQWFISIHVDFATAINNNSLGATIAGQPLSQGAGFNAVGISYQGNDQVVRDGHTFAHYAVWAAGDTIGMALDITNSFAYFSRNGSWLGGGDPVAGTGGIPIDAGHTWFPMGILADSTCQFTINTGAPPAGYTAW